ncbi:hypothetical protein PHYPO_G00137620 [Pangasianodon hypophthalmus]|uniref:Immunoglobulin domain-containing protein n=1 Tax=Pangasianodon hypophthalmus TaxID=310915 RepID=A0A5N5K9P3_PANHP|nr:hypothetical protein PHYPO_G00137620 [Pangasianodon hypophthalmus]
MQSCSIHHCVLFFLTLTFTTAPVSAAVCSTTVKLHQSVTLSCEYKCSGSVKWTLFNNRDVVFARCDQTSCSSLEGYEISHDQYLKGDLSLTITAADYSKRNTYSCECRISEISTVSLSIETVISAVQMKSGKDLILDLSVPEPVEVIYKSRDSADGEQICTVTQRSLQCKAEYTHRTSLSHPNITLRDVQPSDSGSYTIRDTENNEDIQIYTLSVEDEQSGIPVWGIIVIVLILLAGLTGVLIYLKIAPHQEFIKLSRQLQSVDKLVKQAQPSQEQGNKSFNMTGAALKKAEKEIDKLEQQYSENSKYSEQVWLFCKAKRSELNKYRLQYSCEEGGLLLTEREGIMRMTEEVMNSLQQLRGGAGQEQVTSSKSTTMMDEMENQVEKHLEEIEKWCGERRVELKDLIQQHRAGAV